MLLVLKFLYKILASDIITNDKFLLLNLLPRIEVSNAWIWSYIPINEKNLSNKLLLNNFGKKISKKEFEKLEIKIKNFK